MDKNDGYPQTWKMEGDVVINHQLPHPPSP